MQKAASLGWVYCLLMVGPVVACTPPDQRPDRFTNSLGMVMVRVNAPSNPQPGEPRRAYYLSHTEVTNAQYERYKAKHAKRRPRVSAEDDHPATMVSYEQAVLFAQWLTHREKRWYSVPTEAQWQWAAQGGERRHIYGTRDGTLSHDLANYRGTDGLDRWETAAPVGSFPPNPLGLHDMSGNVWEWCAGWYYEEHRAHRVWLRLPWWNVKKLPWFWYGKQHKWSVLRGGSFVHDEPLQRVVVRNAYKPGHQSPSFGFRLALHPSFAP